MTDVRSRLRRASEQVTLPEQAFERMVERRERKGRTARIASAAVALAVTVTFVGGTVALLSGLATDRARPRSGGPEDDPSAHETVVGGPFDEERIARENRETREYVRCMGERGWSLPEPEVWEGPPHPGLLDPPIAIPDEPEAAERYFRDSGACGVRFYDDQSSSSGPSRHSEYDEARIAKENSEVREYMSCMRERGWVLPEPQVWEGPPHPGLLEPPVNSVPDESEAADRYFRDSAECGVEYWDQSGKLLPLDG